MRIRDFFFTLDPGSGMGKKFGSGIRNKQQHCCHLFTFFSSDKSSGSAYCIDATQTFKVLTSSKLPYQTAQEWFLELHFQPFLCILGDGGGRSAGADFRGALHCEGSQVWDSCGQPLVSRHFLANWMTQQFLRNSMTDELNFLPAAISLLNDGRKNVL